MLLVLALPLVNCLTQYFKQGLQRVSKNFIWSEQKTVHFVKVKINQILDDVVDKATDFNVKTLVFRINHLKIEW